MGYEVANHAVLHSLFEARRQALLDQFANRSDGFTSFWRQFLEVVGDAGCFTLHWHSAGSGVIWVTVSCHLPIRSIPQLSHHALSSMPVSFCLE